MSIKDYTAQNMNEIDLGPYSPTILKNILCFFLKDLVKNVAHF